MIWESEWWGTVIKSESQQDNIVIDAMMGRLSRDAKSKYEEGVVEVETFDGLRVVTFSR